MFAEKHGKYRWQDYSDYKYRARVVTAMFRYKTIVGYKMFSRDLPAQKFESKIGLVLKMAELGYWGVTVLGPFTVVYMFGTPSRGSPPRIVRHAHPKYMGRQQG